MIPVSAKRVPLGAINPPITDNNCANMHEVVDGQVYTRNPNAYNLKAGGTIHLLDEDEIYEDISYRHSPGRWYR